MPEISVIVPVYKVEAYLDRCVKSILAQTFTDFELILVDDGSPDRCPEMCDTWAGKDSRIHVIHQKNGGLSAARNAGIDWAFANSDSRWLTFIDSDDWVHPKYLEALYQGAKEVEMDVCIGGFDRTEGQTPKVDQSDLSPRIWQVEDFFVQYNTNAIIACGKLYKKKCFEHIRYPAGRIYEDGAVTYRILFMCRQVCVINQPIYYYFVNPAGITGEEWSLKCLDGLLNYEEQIEYFKEIGNERMVCFATCGYKASWATNVIAARANGYYWKLPKKYRIGFLSAIRMLQKSIGTDRYESVVAQYYPTLVKLQAYGRKIKKLIFLGTEEKK